MTVHLNEIFETSIYTLKKTDKKIFEIAVDQIYELAKDATCFEIGDLLEVDDFRVIPELVRLPYPVCWFEGVVTINRETIGVGTLCWSGGKEIRGHSMLRSRSSKKWVYWVSWILSENGDANFFGVDGEEGGAWMYSKDLLPCVLTTVEKFLSALNCSNVNRVEHKPPEKLQKVRAKRGKKPLFSYWTLEIDLPKSRAAGEDYGGTHASPRLHLRRGHPRQYALGKYCWVQPHVVGSKAAGMVHKDYAARYP